MVHSYFILFLHFISLLFVSEYFCAVVPNFDANKLTRNMLDETILMAYVMCTKFYRSRPCGFVPQFVTNRQTDRPTDKQTDTPTYAQT